MRHGIVLSYNERSSVQFSTKCAASPTRRGELKPAAFFQIGLRRTCTHATTFLRLEEQVCHLRHRVIGASRVSLMKPSICAAWVYDSASLIQLNSSRIKSTY